jgi:hypothetical protein
MLNDAARTAQQTADALKLPVGQITKALFFAASQMMLPCWMRHIRR